MSFPTDAGATPLLQVGEPDIGRARRAWGTPRPFQIDNIFSQQFPILSIRRDFSAIAATGLDPNGVEPHEPGAVALTTRRPERRGTLMNKYFFPALIVSSLAIAGSALAGAGAGDGAGGCDKAEGKAGHGPGERFSQIDTNKDGKVSLAELTASRETWLTRVDTNKDGVATRAEIDASFQEGRKEHLQKMFERDDANKDGALTLDEISNAKPKPAPNAQNGAKAGRMGRFDENGDGKVERAELKTAAERQFARLDKNGDGTLTSDEFGSGHGHFRGRHPKGGEGPTQNKAPVPS
jgi:Ca2+-binding EF-hand superfamily protein